MTTQTVLFLAAAFLILEGLIFVFLWRRGQQRAASAQQWPSVEGQITGISSNEDEGVHTVKAKYKFTVAGKEYQGDTIRVGGVRTSDKGELDQLLTRYAPGQRVTVFHDPANPKQSVLERQAAPAQWVWAAAGGGSIVAGVILAGWALTLA